MKARRLPQWIDLFSQQGFGVNITNGWITNSQHTRSQPHFPQCDGVLMLDHLPLYSIRISKYFLSRGTIQITAGQSPLSHGQVLGSASSAVRATSLYSSYLAGDRLGKSSTCYCRPRWSKMSSEDWRS